MYYHLASWEKIARNVYRNGNTIVIQHMKFLTSPDTRIVGGFLLIFATIYLIALYFEGFTAWKQINPILGIQGIIGLWILLQGQRGITQRKENMGVHPSDTLFIFDGTKQTITKQQNLLSENFASFSEMTLATEKHHGKHTRYYLFVTVAQKKKRLVMLRTKKEAEQLLQIIKTTLNLT